MVVMALVSSNPLDGSVITVARADHLAYERSVRLGVPELVDGLRNLLGAKLVAYLGGVGETRAVRQWAQGDREPSEQVVRRLRLALRVSLILSESDTPPVAQAWFQGANPLLAEVAPARLLREGDLDEVTSPILAAAKSFAAGG